MAMGLAMGWDADRYGVNGDVGPGAASDPKGAANQAVMGGLLVAMNVVVFGLGLWSALLCAEKTRKWALLLRARVCGGTVSDAQMSGKVSTAASRQKERKGTRRLSEFLPHTSGPTTADTAPG